MEAIVTIAIIIGLFFIIKANKWFTKPSTKNEIKSKIPEEVLIANPQNRKRPGTPINKSGTHIVTLFFDI